MNATAGPRIGVYGGSFDPVHIGHLIIAEILRHELRLHEVVFLPVGRPPHKPHQELAANEHRLRMLELALEGAPHFSVSTIDIERAGWSYTADSLAILREAYPNDHEWYFLMGQDSLRDFPNWHRPDLIAAQARLGVALRPNVLVSVEETARSVPETRGRVELVSVPLIGVSSRELREVIRRKGPFRYQVLPSVADYIVAHGLYRDGD